jgi:lycopene beta-cyclase
MKIRKKQMIAPGVSGNTKGNWERHFKMGFGTFANADFKRDLDLNLHQYNMVQGLDFYNQVFEFILNEKNISYVNQK